MSNLIILQVPEEISARARQIAATMAQPVEQVLLNHLKTLLCVPLPVLPHDLRAELDAPHQLSDDTLRTIACAQIPENVQRRTHTMGEELAWGDHR